MEGDEFEERSMVGIVLVMLNKCGKRKWTNWILLFEDGDQWQALMNTEIAFWIP
jgi:hypothetical protein